MRTSPASPDGSAGEGTVPDVILPGLALHREGRLAEAEQAYQVALRAVPGLPLALHLLGLIALQTKRAELGVELIGEAATRDPGNAIAHHDLGNGLRSLGRLNEALEAYTRAVTLRPDYAEAYAGLGHTLHALERHAEALAAYDRAVMLRPDDVHAHHRRGDVLRRLGYAADALESYERALTLRPERPEIHNARAGALRDLGRHTEALGSYEQALCLRPGHADALFNKGITLLQLGQLREGFRLYEWRKRTDRPVANKNFHALPWTGAEDLRGRTIFLHWEQGLGDTLQFCRYVVLLRRLGTEIALSVQDPLVPLLRQMEPYVRIYGSNRRPRTFDYHCALLDLPLVLETTLETIPAFDRYLAPDAGLTARWATRLGPRTRPRVGLAWSGSPTHQNDHNRSIPLDHLRALLDLDIDWICLQRELRAGDAAELQRISKVRFFGKELADFSETAALTAQVDLVVSVDTSIVHLAGAIGKPVWIMLPLNPDWRWLLSGEHSPWYPTARLFRQGMAGDWGDVLKRVQRALALWLARVG